MKDPARTAPKLKDARRKQRPPRNGKHIYIFPKCLCGASKPISRPRARRCGIEPILFDDSIYSTPLNVIRIAYHPTGRTLWLFEWKYRVGILNKRPAVITAAKLSPNVHRKQLIAANIKPSRNIWSFGPELYLYNAGATPSAFLVRLPRVPR